MDSKKTGDKGDKSHVITKFGNSMMGKLTAECRHNMKRIVDKVRRRHDKKVIQEQLD